MRELPLIADFTIPTLGVTLRDYRTMPGEDHRRAVEIAEVAVRQLITDDVVLCSEDDRIEKFRRQAFLDAKAAGLVTNFQELDALGLGLMDDVVSDPRYPDQSLLIYDGPTLVGSFMMLRPRWNPPRGGKIRASTTPWLGLAEIPGRDISTGILWAMFMNHILDADLPLVESSDVLDIQEWIFPIDRPEVDWFTHSDSPGHSMAGIRAAAIAGRDTAQHPGSGIYQYIRRSREVWTTEE